jgi:folate-binding protein YgfZ
MLGPAPSLPQIDLAGVNAVVAGHVIAIQRVNRMVGRSGFLLRAAASDLPPLMQLLLDAGARLCSAETFDTVRIEAGWPLYGRDITEANLPQEVDRDAQVISFKKGCYLGQETVARIDALGHVNRKLRGLKFAGEVTPDAGTPLTIGDKNVGEVTSAVISPTLGAPLALGYVRRGHNEIGTRLNSPFGEVEVVALPVGYAQHTNG